MKFPSGATGRTHIVRFTKFGLVGCLNTVIDAALFFVLFYGLDVPLLWANTASYAAGLLNSFFLNKRWTFADKSSGTAAVFAFVRFAGFNLVGLLIANGVILAASRVLPVPVAKIVSIAVAMFWNYWASGRFAFTASQREAKSEVKS